MAGATEDQFSWHQSSVIQERIWDKLKWLQQNLVFKINEKFNNSLNYPAFIKSLQKKIEKHIKEKIKQCSEEINMQYGTLSDLQFETDEEMTDALLNKETPYIRKTTLLYLTNVRVNVNHHRQIPLTDDLHSTLVWDWSSDGILNLTVTVFLSH